MAAACSFNERSDHAPGQPPAGRARGAGRAQIPRQESRDPSRIRVGKELGAAASVVLALTAAASVRHSPLPLTSVPT